MTSESETSYISQKQDRMGNPDHYSNQMIDVGYRIPQNLGGTGALLAKITKQTQNSKPASESSFQFGGYVSRGSSSNQQDSPAQSILSNVSDPLLSVNPRPHYSEVKHSEEKLVVMDSSGGMEQSRQYETQTISTKDQEMVSQSSPDSVRDAFLQQSNAMVQPMTLRHKRLKSPTQQIVDDGGSATFGKHIKPNLAFFNLKKVIENRGRVQKCQIRRDCKNESIGFCSEKTFRGCTLAFCEEHSGLVNRQKNEWLCCRVCSKDKHSDICQECSTDIIGQRVKFYTITLILSFMIFFILMFMIHMLLESAPDLCQQSAAETSFCGTFQRAIHSLNPYTANRPSINMSKANTALHMFNQIDSPSTNN